MEKEVRRDKIRGCLIGGGVGDALGYPVEFRRENAIWEKYGPGGIQAYEPDRRCGKVVITDDTQMTLFTANGLLMDIAARRCGNGTEQESPAMWVYQAYQDWLTTQSVGYAEYRDSEEKGVCWLMNIPELFALRAPGNMCLHSLEEFRAFGNVRYEDLYKKRNDSKGCGGVMRVAPMGLLHRADPELVETDKIGAELAMITHCHSLGYMPAAVLVHIISRLVFPHKEMTLEEIVIETRDAIAKIYADDENLFKLLLIINAALRLAKNEEDDLTNIHKLGEGWVAEEALGIALYCALRYQNDFSKAMIVSVNHKGDSDSTGAVTGNILGALIGYEAIDDKWKEELELRETILEVADDIHYANELAEQPELTPDSKWLEKYLRK